MKIQEFKILFENIAKQLVNHVPGDERLSRFAMIDPMDFVVAAKTKLISLREFCIDVSYPFSTFSIEGNTNFEKITFLVNISKIVGKDAFDEQAVCLQEAKDIAQKFVRYLYWVG
jgi:hypothetical protein